MLSFVLAGGTFLVSRATGGAFAILAAATVGWFLFPYAEVPWATVITGAQAETIQATAAAWWYGSGILALATVEVLVSAREALLATLRRARLPTGPGSLVRAHSRTAMGRLMLGTLLVGGAATGLYALGRDTLVPDLVGDPSLLWAPVALGALVAVVLWWIGRDR